MISKQEYKSYLLQGVEYNHYKFQMEEDLHSNEDEKIKTYIKLNLARMNRVEKTYSISGPLVDLLKKLNNKVYWIVLTEHWCGDASQSLPVMNEIANASNGWIELKVLYRDQHPELMNAHLTNGTKSIPKLVQFDVDFNMIYKWGPRPMVAQNLVKKLKSNPITANSYANELHLWYAKDKQKTLDEEIRRLLLSSK